MIQTNTNMTGIGQVINISGVETNFQTASICEKVKIKIHNLTPNRGPVNIPVRFENPINTTAIEKLEEIAKYGIATKSEYRAMEKIHRLMESIIC